MQRRERRCLYDDLARLDRAAPRAGDRPIDHDGRPEDPVATGHDGLAVLGREDGRAVLVAQDVLVEAGQEVDPHGGSSSLEGLGCQEVRGPVQFERRECGTGDADPDAYLGEGEARPAGQVLRRGRPVTGEVPPRELTEGLVWLKAARMGHPLVKQGEGLLPTVRGPQDERTSLREVPQQVVATLPDRAHAAGLRCRPRRASRVRTRPSLRAATARSRASSTSRSSMPR